MNSIQFRITIHSHKPILHNVTTRSHNLKNLYVSMNFFVNEDRRLTKNFPQQLFSKLKIFVLLSSKSLLISDLFHI